jgi:hypothetical protein
MIGKTYRVVRKAVAKLMGTKSGPVTFSHSESNEGSRYIVYKASSWQDAMTFLRQQEVKESLMYLIVETPEGNIGKDLISIFDEGNGNTLELGKRKPLHEPKKSKTHCSRCGYFVLPCGPLIKGVHYYISLEDMQKRGQGFFCYKCQAIWCAFCVTLDGTKCTCPFCGESMVSYTTEK